MSLVGNKMSLVASDCEKCSHRHVCGMRSEFETKVKEIPELPLYIKTTVSCLFFVEDKPTPRNGMNGLG